MFAVNIGNRFQVLNSTRRDYVHCHRLLTRGATATFWKQLVF